VGFIDQTSCPVADSDKITISLWGLVPGPVADDFTCPIIQWGQRGDGTFGSGIVYNHNGGFPFLACRFSGQPLSVSGAAIWHGDSANPVKTLYPDGTPGPHVYNGLAGLYDPALFTSTYTPSCSFNLDLSSSSLRFPATPGKVFHVLLSVDVSADSKYGETGATWPASSTIVPSSWNTYKAMANGTVLSDGGTNFGDVGTMFSSLDAVGGGYHPPNYTHGLAVSPNAFPSGPLQWFNVMTGLTVLDSVYGWLYTFVPGWEIGFAGQPIGIPTYGGALDRAFSGPAPSTTPVINSQIKLRNVQIWTGQAIDPSANYATFVKPNPGGYTNGGTPMDPSVARTAFGTETFAFIGGKTAGIIDGGTGGAFAKTGTVNDASILNF
jgi:hypothetical protein